MNARQFADALGIPRGTVRRWVHEGLPHRKYGNQIIIDPARVETWVKEKLGARDDDHRMNAKIIRGAGCWDWEGCVDEHGRPKVWRKGKMVAVARVLWEAEHGPIPKGIQLRNRCDTPACSKPSHHFLVPRGKTR